MYNSWSREDDTRLWARRSKPTAVLAEEFGRSNGGIRSRLKHLQNPQHKAYQRLFGDCRGNSRDAVTREDISGGTDVKIDSKKLTERGLLFDRMLSGIGPYARESRNPPSTSYWTGTAPEPAKSGNDIHASNSCPTTFPPPANPGHTMYASNSYPATFPPPANPGHTMYASNSYPTTFPPPTNPGTSMCASNSYPTTYSFAPTSQEREIFSSAVPSTYSACHHSDVRQIVSMQKLRDCTKGATKGSNPIVDGTLNEEQKRILNLVLSGRNIFLTGAAGVGKSFLLRHIVAKLKARQGDCVAVTASTGIAASHISGTTLHSWAGIGIASGKDVGKLVQKVFANQTVFSRWLTTKVLIIDEISMIDGVLFGALDQLAKTVRCNTQPFGGIQLVLSGDFYQLPPVSLRYTGFAFSSNAWKNGNIIVAELKTIVRQEGDMKFANILKELRQGKCSNETEKLLATCHASRKRVLTDGIVPTKLYCTNKNVDSKNQSQLAKLPGTMFSFQSIDRFKGSYSRQIQVNLRKMMDKKLPMVIGLKRGAQVMLMKNTPEWGLVNGSRGVVVGFNEKRSNCPMVLFSNGSTHTIEPFKVFQATAGGAMTRKQFPLKLAWCLTVHKSQGMTLDRLELQLDDAFDYGQAYVALSRVTSLKGLWIKGAAITQKLVKAHPDVIEFHKNRCY